METIKSKVICTDYDSMGDFSRFPNPKEIEKSKNIFWYIKKMFVYLFSI